ncbi:MAG: hypothetical protein ACJ0GJ_04260 [Candidatus Actinomarina sp.]
MDHCRYWNPIYTGNYVGLYPTNPPSEVKYLLEHSESKILFAEDQEQVDKALED